ncbi:alpha-mannosidase [Oceanispirochaeta crateris]|uniref:alpha-mannosidase n=1 Tax=Oceanispirochaeta crateris TaxID=2518645 RepID=UPI00143DEC7D|nr:alpha-mannosidase [Oceanispirochaeta crateris]
MNKIHLVGNAHLDPVWLWRWQEGYAEVKATFRSALDRMKEFPDFIFTCAGGAYYKWVEENDPAMFEEIVIRVNEKRWVPVGGWWIQPDCNIPCGESFIRQGLIGQRYLLEKFGFISDVGYNVDSFGHDGMLPQILAKSGLVNYVFMRPDVKENDEIPSVLFQWESPDGSQVCSFRIPVSYSDYIGSTRNCYEEKLRMAAEEVSRLDMDLMEFYGVGNHGGGPTVRTIKTLQKVGEEIGDKAQILFSTPSTYFHQMKKSKPSLEVYSSSLRQHAPGCYSNLLSIKRGNRQGENALLAAERFSVLSGWLSDHVFPSESLQRGWEGLLFNQFHDLLGGCSIERAYQDAAALHGEVSTIASREENMALQKISWKIDTWWIKKAMGKDKHWQSWEQDDFGIPVVVFNPHSWEYNGYVTNKICCSRVEDESGQFDPHQIIRGAYNNNKDEKWATLFPVSIPPLGYRVYRLYLTKENPEIKSYVNSMNITQHSIENQYLVLKFNPETGSVSSLIRKETGFEYISGEASLGLVIDDSHCDTWGHGEDRFDLVEGRFGQPEFSIIEEGPLRCCLRVVTKYGQSKMVLDYYLTEDGHDITVRGRVLWLEKYRMLKIAFPVKMINSECLQSLTFGYDRTNADGKEKVGQKWVALRGEDPLGRMGILAIANDGFPAHSFQDDEVRLTILRSPEYADHMGEKDGFIPNIDMGTHSFSYALIPSDAAEVESEFVSIFRGAEELNLDPTVITETYHKGTLPLIQDGIAISNENVFSSALKESWDKSGYILRCSEISGLVSDTTIELPLLGVRFDASFTPFELKTFKISKKDKRVQEVNLIEL